MIKRSMERKLRTKLRLLTARRLTLELRNPTYRTHLEEDGWTPGSAIIPCEWDTPFHEVLTTVHRRKEAGETSFLIPVLIHAQGEMKIQVLLATGSPTDTFWEVNADEIHPDVPMKDVADVLRRDRDWSTELLSLEGIAGAAELLDLC
ncbi:MULTISPECIES: hypothetical protein [unclassified Corynebacterium]|uniref:hypothetical protein n=1 Tax=unclassified Corynebacterium TaxID=2624378 RepID=UPI0029CA4009|nr:MULTISPECIES: hypothetical protein [unclassified Corynebacterium]WPF65296.1 hypothetical protein OLX12_06825 [Corynebacterium sp. 22KM0430]WPF67791.1 hypothetical protein OLW90_06815 [Corynebacterium sp. 21KM1197]